MKKKLNVHTIGNTQFNVDVVSKMSKTAFEKQYGKVLDDPEGAFEELKALKKPKK